MCRTSLIQNALCSPVSEETFTYSEHDHEWHSLRKRCKKEIIDLILFRLQKTHSLRQCKNFLWHLWTCSGYVKFSPETGEHIAFWIRDIRHIEKNGALQGGQLWVFWNQGKIQPKSGQKFSSFSVFWKCFLTLRRCKKFSIMTLMNMFWVCKSFFSMGTQRILNHGRTAHKKTERFKTKIVPKMVQTYI